MNIDFIKCTKELGQDKLCFDGLIAYRNFKNGVVEYLKHGKFPIRIWHNSLKNTITVLANFAYYISRQNYDFPTTKLKETIQMVSEDLNINLFDANVSTFEFQAIVPIDSRPSDLLRNHIRFEKARLHEFLGRSFEPTGKVHVDKNFKLKLYDVVANFKSKLDLPTRREITRLYGFDEAKHYIKVEMHYNKPLNHFGLERLVLEDLLKPGFQATCKQDLICHYGKIQKMGNFLPPASKSELNSATIPWTLLLEYTNLDAIDLIGLTKAKLRCYPELLNADDFKARVKQAKINLNKVTRPGSSPYDLTEKLYAQQIQ